MVTILLAPECVAFSGALMLMLLIGVVEAAGLGAGAIDLDAGADVPDAGLLGWLGFGRVPLLVALIAFLASFGTIGLVGQQLALSALGHLVNGWIAVPAAAVAALPCTRLLSAGLARIMPRDETTAFPLDALVGLTGTILLGHARRGSPTRARVIDPHGQAHHILIEPDDDSSVFDEGDVVLLVRRDGPAFRGILYTSHRFNDWTVS